MESIINYFKNLINFLNPLSENFILLKLWDFLTTLIDYLNPFSENFILLKLWDFLSSIISNFSVILSYINPFSENFLGLKLIELLSNLLKALFIPSEEALSNFFLPIQERFSFVDQAKAFSNEIKTMLETGEGVPTFKLNINSKYYSGEIVVLDLTFFAPYKQYSDMVITAFVYILFAWRFIKNLPATIKGFSSGIDQINRFGGV